MTLLPEDDEASQSSRQGVGRGSWQVAGASVRGATHIHRNLFNQDAAQWFVGPDGRSFAVAVADGHGASVYTRSDRGARFAVALAIEELRILSDAEAKAVDIRWSGLPERVVGRWRKAVQRDLASEPLPDEEAAALANQDLDAASAYGATLLAAGVTGNCGFALQLGDGTTYLVDVDGSVASVLNPPELPGESTFSLCMPDALDFVQAHIFDVVELDRLAGIVISTDGFSKSFRNNGIAAAQIKTVTDRMSWDSPAAMSRELDKWLKRVSAAGSGDDISLVVAARRGTSG
jgi:Protein phosphatase 2C